VLGVFFFSFFVLEDGSSMVYRFELPKTRGETTLFEGGFVIQITKQSVYAF